MALVPEIRRVDPGRASRNALAEALATQQFMGTIKAGKQRELERGLSREATAGGERAAPALRELAGENIAAAQDVQTVLGNMKKSELAEIRRRSQFLGKQALGILSAADADKPALYEAGLIAAQDQGFDVANMPPQWSPEIEPQLQSIIGQAMTVEQQVSRADAELDRLELARGASEQIVKLQGALRNAVNRGDTKAAREIQKKIDKVTAPAVGKTEFDVAAPTRANITKNQNIIDEGENTLGLIGDLRAVIKDENLGAVGDIRLFWQGIRGQVEAVNQSMSDVAVDLGATGNVAAWFDPSLSTKDLLANQLAYRLALANNPDGRISDPDFRNAQKALGFDRAFTGALDVVARLDAFEKQIVRAQDVAYRRLGQDRPAAAPVPPAPTKDTGASSVNYPEGTETDPNAEGVVMIIRNGEWVVK